MSYYRFDMDTNNSFEELSNAIKSVSFFDEAKLIIVKNIFSVRFDSLDKLSGLIGDLGLTNDKKIVLVFVENSKKTELQKANKALSHFLNAEPSTVREINYLEGVKLSNWVKGKFKENGHNVSPAVVGLLTNVVGNESWALANEINKLSNYKKGGQVIEKDVNLLVDQKEENSIFDLVDAVGNKNKAKAFEMMYRLLNSGQDGHYLLSMLFYHFENLLSVCEGSVPKHIHPFVAKKAISQANRFKKEDLLAKFNHLAGLDVASKSGTVNLEDSLYNLVLS